MALGRTTLMQPCSSLYLSTSSFRRIVTQLFFLSTSSVTLCRTAIRRCCLQSVFKRRSQRRQRHERLLGSLRFFLHQVTERFVMKFHTFH